MQSRQNYLVLHRTEWDRLQRKQSAETTNHQREEYFRSLTEQSQKWINLWPDTVQGHVNQLKKQRETKHDKSIETVKMFSLLKKHESTSEAIIKAEESIFAASCYGRQSLSALLESKTLEERDLQVKFQKELKAQADIRKLNEPNAASLLNAKQMDINEITNKLRSTQNARDVAKYNKAILQMKQAKAVKEKEDKKFELEGCLITQQMERNAEIESNRLFMEKRGIKHWALQNQNIKDFRAQKEEQYEKIRESWRKYQDKVRCKEKIVFSKIHNEKYAPQKRKIFNTIKDIEDIRNKEYDAFVQKGIDRWLDRTAQSEQKEIEDSISRCKERKLLDEENKILVELQKLRSEQENSKYTCCRQCILTKSCVISKQKINPKKTDIKQSSFILPKNKYIENNKNRPKEPTPWRALEASHAQFYRHARETLQECHYKNATQKIINDYTRINCIDPKSLQNWK